MKTIIAQGNLSWRRVLFVLLIQLLTLCLSSQVDAQGTNASVDSQGFSLKSFNVNTTKIDPNFKGHNIVDLYKAVDKLLNLKKSEFETTADYKQRVRETITKANDSIDYGELKMGDYVAFPMNSNRDSKKIVSYKIDYPAEFIYDADSRTLKVSRKRTWNYSKSLFFLPLLRTGIDNSLGLYDVGFYFERTLKAKVINEFSVFTGEVDPEYAEKNLNKLRGLFVGQLFPYDNEQFKEEIKTISSQPGIPLNNVQFWIYNIETGEVVVKYTSFELENGTNRALGDTTLDTPMKFYRKIKREQKRSAAGPQGQNADNQSTTSSSAKVTSSIPSIEDAWEEILAGRKQLKPQSWEKKEPAVIVDSETPNLADALQNAAKGSVVQIAKGTRIKLDASAALANAVAIAGETGDPQDAIVVVAPDEVLTIQSSNVFFKGVTFEVDVDSNEQSLEPIVKVDLLGNVLFIDCAFLGNRSIESSGVLIDEGNAKFWNCAFKDFGDAGVVAQNEGSGTAAYCEFSGNKTGVKADSKGTIDSSACFFSNNDVGFDAQENGGGRVKSCLFDANENAWNADYKSRSSVEFDKKTNVVNK